MNQWTADVDTETGSAVDSTGSAAIDTHDHLAPTSPATPPHLSRRARRKQRVSKWDRPPEPHDWRFFVGHLGRVLITTGLMLFLFVAYQLWGTGIETARAQNRLDTQFQQLVAEESAPDATPIPNVVTETGVVTDPGSEGVAFQALPLPLPQPNQTIDASAPAASAPAAPTTPYDVVVPAADQNLPVVERDLVLGNIEIPSIGIDFLFVPGVTHEDLKQGIGYFPDTPLPGQLGNSALAGHRTTYKHPFGDLDKVNVSDDITVTLNNGGVYTYVITGTIIVNPEDYWVISNSDPNLATLTLITCTPKATSKQRLVVFAELDPARSDAVGQATLPQLEEVARALLPDEPPATVAPVATASAPAAPVATASAPTMSAPTMSTVATAPSTALDARSAPATTIAELVGGTNSIAAPVTTTPTTAEPVTISPGLDIEDGASPSGDDAFSGSWFDDTDAWPHIAGWGTLLSIIAIGAYLISRKTRHDSIGVLAGIAPFTVCLYFFFENVNRLLPPGL